jgi:hypothetical protein
MWWTTCHRRGEHHMHLPYPARVAAADVVATLSSNPSSWRPCPPVGVTPSPPNPPLSAAVFPLPFFPSLRSSFTRYAYRSVFSVCSHEPVE